MASGGWKQEALELYFQEHLSVKEISARLGVTRKYITAHLKGQPGYAAEKEFRKSRSRQKRREYQRAWDRENRAGRYEVTADTLRLEHIQAVKELSHERYH